MRFSSLLIVAIIAVCFSVSVDAAAAVAAENGVDESVHPEAEERRVEPAAVKRRSQEALLFASLSAYPIIDCEKMSAAGLTCNSVINSNMIPPPGNNGCSGGDLGMEFEAPCVPRPLDTAAVGSSM